MSWSVGSLVPNSQERNTFNYSSLGKWDKTFLLQSTSLFTLCCLFLLILMSGLYSVSCSVNIICHRAADRLKSGPFYFPAGGWCDWGKRQQQSLFTHFPLTLGPPYFLYSTNSLCLPRTHSCKAKKKNLIKLHKEPLRYPCNTFQQFSIMALAFTSSA